MLDTATQLIAIFMHHLNFKRPLIPVGILVGYKVYFQEN